MGIGQFWGLHCTDHLDCLLESSLESVLPGPQTEGVIRNSGEKEGNIFLKSRSIIRCSWFLRDVEPSAMFRLSHGKCLPTKGSTEALLAVGGAACTKWHQPLGAQREGLLRKQRLQYLPGTSSIRHLTGFWGPPLGLQDPPLLGLYLLPWPFLHVQSPSRTC